MNFRRIPNFGNRVYRFELYQTRANAFQIQDERTRQRLGGCRRAAHGLLLALAAWRIYFYGDCRQFGRGLEYTRGECARACRPAFLSHAVVLILSLALIGSAAFLSYRRRVAKLEKEKTAQQAFSQQLIESEEAERKRIAVELHDGLGQSLVVIKNRALIGLNTPENHERLLSQMGEISEAASAAMSEVRGIARNLHPYQLDYLGLTTALKTMIESVADASNIAITSEIDELNGELPKAAEINLYRIVQEALNNV